MPDTHGSEYLLIIRWSHDFDPARRVDVHRFIRPDEVPEAAFERFVTQEAAPQILRFSTREEHPEAVSFLRVSEPHRGHEAGEVQMDLEGMGVGRQGASFPAGLLHEGRGFREIEVS